MKMVEIPKFFHEIFGKRSTVLELALTLSACIGISALILLYTYSEWIRLGLWRGIGMILLALDINGGVIANFTRSTNDYYKSKPKGRILFLLIHVQPIILAVLFGDYFIPCMIIWAYTIASAFVVNSLMQHPAQKSIAAVFTAVGMCILILFFSSLPRLLLITLMFFLWKVAFSFAVDHYAEGATSHE